MNDFLRFLGAKSIDTRVSNPGVNAEDYLLRGSKEMTDRYTQDSKDILTRKLDDPTLDQSRGMQLDFINEMANRLKLPGMSSSDISFQKNMEDARNAVSSNVASMRGINAGLAARLGSEQLGNIVQRQALDASNQKIQEQNQLAGLTSNLRSQDQEKLLTTQNLNDQLAKMYDQLNFNYRQAEQQGNIAKDTNRINSAIQTDRTNADLEARDVASQNTLLGGFYSTLGNVLGLPGLLGKI